MNHDKNHLLGCEGNFVWGFWREFYVETEEGNFIWSDPDYGGDNSFRYTEKTYHEWIGDAFGRDKGRHTILSYCGDQIIVS